MVFDAAESGPRGAHPRPWEEGPREYILKALEGLALRPAEAEMEMRPRRWAREGAPEDTET